MFTLYAIKLFKLFTFFLSIFIIRLWADARKVEPSQQLPSWQTKQSTKHIDNFENCLLCNWNKVARRWIVFDSQSKLVDFLRRRLLCDLGKIAG